MKIPTTTYRFLQSSSHFCCLGALLSPMWDRIPQNSIFYTTTIMKSDTEKWPQVSIYYGGHGCSPIRLFGCSYFAGLVRFVWFVGWFGSFGSFYLAALAALPHLARAFLLRQVSPPVVRIVRCLQSSCLSAAWFAFLCLRFTLYGGSVIVWHCLFLHYSILAFVPLMVFPHALRYTLITTIVELRYLCWLYFARYYTLFCCSTLYGPFPHDYVPTLHCYCYCYSILPHCLIPRFYLLGWDFGETACSSNKNIASSAPCCLAA